MIDDDGAFESVTYRTEFARGALVDMGRPDLASRLLDPQIGQHAVWWEPVVGPADRVLICRAVALASLSQGYDEIGLICERCILTPIRDRPLHDLCGLVNRSDFVARRDCSQWAT